MTYKTDQEEFWAGEFGTEYIRRNTTDQGLATNLSFFATALKQAGHVRSLIEFGANVGVNLQAIKLLYPQIRLHGLEINRDAADILQQVIGAENVSNKSIFDYAGSERFDVALIKGVLIHINPEMLNVVYDKLYNSANRYVLMCEYYNPVPVAVNYRGHSDRLFKRDFAGEFLRKYPDFKLVDYGFVYKGDPAFPQDDITWFLLRKSLSF
jgi:pseudaminic acid biosynthesis-associated methylase